jgi:serine/threonine protein phosphatase PrpC
VGSPDYSVVLDALPGVSPAELIGLLRSAAEPLNASEVRLFLVDFQGTSLQQVLVHEAQEIAVGEHEVATSLPGRVFRTGEPAVLDRDGMDRVWVPLVERGERTGVLALSVPEATAETVADCVRLGRFAGLLVRSFARTTDLLHLRRRRRSMTLAAGMQWDLLPPLTLQGRAVLACGRLEPAYEIAGDAFDYAINERHLHFGIFDGMGHGVASTLMTALAVGAYRHARRAGENIPDMYRSIDESLADQLAGEAFVTSVLGQLDLEDGRLEWMAAGHPTPLLMREHRVLRQLSCAASMPLGLSGRCVEVAVDRLEPGDMVLLFTDGVIEGRDASGEEFSLERLIDLWAKHVAAGHQPEEVLRLLVDDIMGYSPGQLRDDASLLLIRWMGPPAKSERV